jgi:hypothetical protein
MSTVSESHQLDGIIGQLLQLTKSLVLTIATLIAGQPALPALAAIPIAEWRICSNNPAISDPLEQKEDILVGDNVPRAFLLLSRRLH